MARILFGVTGSVAAIRTPVLYSQLVARGHDVKVVATRAARYFFPLDLFLNAASQRDGSKLILDEDEWPGAGEGNTYTRGDSVLHIELRRWAELFVIAPLDANTLGKITAGICDNCLTCVWRAWDASRPVVLAPAMNTLMWQHPMTARQLRQLASDASLGELPANLGSGELIDAINKAGKSLHVVPPQVKELACGDIGIGAMADVDAIVEAVEQAIG